MHDTWYPLAVPPFCERLIAFSVPREECVLAVAYDCTCLIRLQARVEIQRDEETLAYDNYDPTKGIANYCGETYQMIGLHGGRPIVHSPQGERLDLGDELRLWRGDDVAFETNVENLSGDWAAATFSPDGELLVLGCPYDFDFRAWRRVTG